MQCVTVHPSLGGFQHLKPSLSPEPGNLWQNPAEDVFFGRNQHSKTPRWFAELGAALAFAIPVLGYSVADNVDHLPRSTLNSQAVRDNVDQFRQTDLGINYIVRSPDYFRRQQIQKAIPAINLLLTHMLSQRPDLLQMLEKTPEGLNIVLWDKKQLNPETSGTAHASGQHQQGITLNLPIGIFDLAELEKLILWSQQPYNYACNNITDPAVPNGKSMENFPTPTCVPILEGMLDKLDNFYKILVQETTHGLDFLGAYQGEVYVVGPDGLLPGMSREDRKWFASERTRIQQGIRSGKIKSE